MLDVFEVVNINPDVEELMVEGFIAAGPVLMTTIQLLTVNSLLHNILQFTHETVHCSATEAFKVDLNKETMMDYLFNSILMRRHPVERRQSLYNCSHLANQDTLPQATSRGNFFRDGNNLVMTTANHLPVPDLASTRTAPCQTLTPCAASPPITTRMRMLASQLPPHHSHRVKVGNGQRSTHHDVQQSQSRRMKRMTSRMSPSTGPFKDKGHPTPSYSGPNRTVK